MKKRTGCLIKRGRIYFVRWIVNGKVFVKTTKQTNLKDAEAERDRIMAPFVAKDERDILEGIAEQITTIGEDLARKQPPVLIDAAWKLYLKAPNRPQSGERTLDGYGSHFNRFAAWMKKHHPAALELRDVDRRIAEAYAADLRAAKVRPSTYNQHVKLLDLVWSVLGEQGRITVNPWSWDKKRRAGMARMKLNKTASRHAPLDPEQVERLISIADGDLKDLFTVLAFTGQRLFDCVHLRWESIKDGGKLLEIVQRKMERRSGGEPVFVPVLPPVAAVLDNRKRCGQYVFPDLVELYSRDAGSTLSKRIGEVFDRGGFTRTREGADGQRGIAAYGAHSFRHAFVSNARAFGIPDGLISQITGHKTEDMLSHYSHFTRKMAGALARKAGRAVRPAAALPAAAVDAGEIAAEVRRIAELVGKAPAGKIRTELKKLAEKIEEKKHGQKIVG